MARTKRKTAQDEIPLERPPSSEPSLEDIPAEEQFRIIEESGLLGHLQEIEKPEQQARHRHAEPEKQDFADEVFFAAMLIVPLTFLYLCMDM